MMLVRTSGCSNPSIGFTAQYDGYYVFPKDGYLFIPMRSGIYGNKVWRCPFDATTGAVSTCLDTGASGLNHPSFFWVQGGFAYITNIDANSVTRCTYTAGSPPSLSSCGSAGATGLSSPHAMAFDTVNNFAFIVNSNANTVTRCAANFATGLLSGCTPLSGV
jgi:hypothetical protein